MKSTKWISLKLMEVLSEIVKLEKQIKERNINDYEDLKNQKLIINGIEMTITLNEYLTSLVAKKTILEEILKP